MGALTGVSLARNTLLDARLLAGSAAGAAAAATRLAEGVLSFVQKARHVCGVVVGCFGWYGIVRVG